MAYEIVEGTRRIENVVQEVIFQVLGGREAAAERLGVTRQAIHYLLASPYIRDRKLALRLAEMTGIPAAELMALTPWQPETRGNGPKGGRKGPNGSGPRPHLASAKPLAGGGAESLDRPSAVAKGKRTPRSYHRTACTPLWNPAELQAKAA
jgi:hypothetical protein